MDTSICIGSNKIQMACGTAKNGKVILDSVETVMLYDETIINGIVTDEVDFKNAIEKLIVAFPEPAMKDVRITIESGPALVKVRKVPNLKDPQMLEWIKGEFEEGEDKLIYDYMILEQDKTEGDTALICAIKESIVEEIIRIFSNMDISISCIDIGLSSQIKFVHQMKITEGKTFVILNIDGQNLDATLYINGVFKMVSRARLLSLQGTLEMGDEIDKEISKLVQFNYGEKNSGEIEFIYFSGMSREQRKIEENKNQEDAIELRNISVDALEMVEIKESNFLLGDYLYTVGNLFKK